MFNKSLSIDYFTDIRKMSFVSPVHKFVDKRNATNYRPISKLSIIQKNFEAKITKKLNLIISPYICLNPHGFRPKNLKCYLHSIIMFKLIPFTQTTKKHSKSLITNYFLRNSLLLISVDSF
jgi:hypothetical protein